MSVGVCTAQHPCYGTVKAQCSLQVPCIVEDLVKGVLTSGDLAGINLLTWFVFIWRGKVFHGVEREFRLEVICTCEKYVSWSLLRSLL